LPERLAERPDSHLPSRRLAHSVPRRFAGGDRRSRLPRPGRPPRASAAVRRRRFKTPSPCRGRSSRRPRAPGLRC